MPVTRINAMRRFFSTVFDTVAQRLHGGGPAPDPGVAEPQLQVKVQSGRNLLAVTISTKESINELV